VCVCVLMFVCVCVCICVRACVHAYRLEEDVTFTARVEFIVNNGVNHSSGVCKSASVQSRLLIVGQDYVQACKRHN